MNSNRRQPPKPLGGIEKSKRNPYKSGMDGATQALHDDETVRRIERWQNEQQISINATREDVSALKLGHITIQRDIAALGASIDRLVTRVEEGRKTNWPLLGVVVALLPLTLAGLGFFVTSYTAGSLAPVNATLASLQQRQEGLGKELHDVSSIQQSRGREISSLVQSTTLNGEAIKSILSQLGEVQRLATASTAADANSAADRASVTARLTKLEESVSRNETERRATSAEVRVQLGEVEGQFHAISNLENLRASWQNRINAMLWEKAYKGERYPSETFFPTSIFQGPGGAPPLGK